MENQGAACTQDYLRALRRPFVKLCRLRFLQPDGSVAFALDNSALRRRNGAFVAAGNISCHLQNGQRRTACVTLVNEDGEFEYNVNRLWFGTEVALDEGLLLPDGTQYYIQQGVFLLENPIQTLQPGQRTMQYNLVDKWANLDGTLFGKLESTYHVPEGTNIFEPIRAILALDRGNGRLVDRVRPVFTEYYNGKTQEIAGGGSALLTACPYDFYVENESGCYADVCLGMAGMVNAWIGYDTAGALRVDPSQDDILDTGKPVLWKFSLGEAELLGATYQIKNTEVFNDYIVLGGRLSNNAQPSGRAQNLDPKSDTNVMSIGRKTIRESAAGYATDTQCRDLAVWKLKRATVLQKAVSIRCTQLFHIEENALVELVRTDRPGSPVERHLVTGFSRPLAGTGQMTIECVSVHDFPVATLTSWPEGQTGG